jgi:putative redox protein
MPKVNIHQIKGKQLLITGRSHAVIGDQPVEKGGSDIGLTPTELLLSALGSCMAFNLLAYAQLKNFKIHELQVELEDEVAKSPERVSKISARIRLAGDLTEEERNRLLRSAKSCKIHNTLRGNPAIEVALIKGD